LITGSDHVETRPTLRILHHMARSGGTIISRCLGAMDRVVLLSEIHPLGTRVYNPLEQAEDWYGLLTQDDIARASSTTLDFADAIELVEQRCREQGRLLVLRDWSHIDYTGVPFTRPVYHSQLVRVLESRFRLLRFSTVRHPLDQWLSMNRQAIMRGKISPPAYLKGFRAFAQMAGETGFIRYEDFTQHPDNALRTICTELNLPFDPAWQQGWQSNVFVTGDVHPGRAGDQIQPLERRKVDAKTEGVFAADSSCTASLSLLGYSRSDPG
jgi:hypothetical protein